MSPDLRIDAKTVGILTFHFVPNYGAVWQTYALQKYIQGIGVRATVVDYQPRHVNDGGAFWLPVSRWRCRANAVIAYQKYLRARRWLSGQSDLDAKFRAFVEERLQLSPVRYRSLRQLRRQPPACDALICGSDQIWNPSVQYGVDPAYFLDFASADQVRIAYAASFGRAQVEARHHRVLAELLGKLEHISVREDSGAALCRDLAGRSDVLTLPDPTLLHDGYPEAREPDGLPAEYIFSYVLRSGGAVNDAQRRLAQETGLPIVSPVNAHGVQSNCDISLVADPCEWLGCIRGAKMVMTNSFHGTIFSILFKRPFLTMAIGSGKQALNERAKHLLRQLGLEDRFVQDPDPATVSRLIATPIDWEAADRRLRAWRDDAARFLRDALA